MLCDIPCHTHKQELKKYQIPLDIICLPSNIPSFTAVHRTHQPPPPPKYIVCTMSDTTLHPPTYTQHSTTLLFEDNACTTTLIHTHSILSALARCLFCCSCFISRTGIHPSRYVGSASIVSTHSGWIILTLEAKGKSVRAKKGAKVPSSRELSPKSAE